MGILSIDKTTFRGYHERVSNLFGIKGMVFIIVTISQTTKKRKDCLQTDALV
jgi:hypothetical protein